MVLNDPADVVDGSSDKPLPQDAGSVADDRDVQLDSVAVTSPHASSLPRPVRAALSFAGEEEAAVPSSLPINVKDEHGQPSSAITAVGNAPTASHFELPKEAGRGEEEDQETHDERSSSPTPDDERAVNNKGPDLSSMLEPVASTTSAEGQSLKGSTPEDPTQSLADEQKAREAPELAGTVEAANGVGTSSSLFGDDEVGFLDLAEVASSPSQDRNREATAADLFAAQEDDFLKELVSEAEDRTNDVSFLVHPQFASESQDVFLSEPTASLYESSVDEGALVEEVPEGWYGEDGEWHWYTVEERDLVRRSMGLEMEPLDEPDLDPSSNSPLGNVGTTWLAATPAPIVPSSYSESDARRTPVPNVAVAEEAPYDPYTPSAYVLKDPYSARQPLQEPYSARQFPHDQTHASGSRWSADPISTVPYPTSDPNAAFGVAPTATVTSSIRPSDRPSIPSAYDPPQLKSQKSFVRPRGPHANTALDQPFTSVMQRDVWSPGSTTPALPPQPIHPPQPPRRNPASPAFSPPPLPSAPPRSFPQATAPMPHRIAPRAEPPPPSPPAVTQTAFGYAPQDRPLYTKYASVAEPLAFGWPVGPDATASRTSLSEDVFAAPAVAERLDLSADPEAADETWQTTAPDDAEEDPYAPQSRHSAPVQLAPSHSEPPEVYQGLPLDPQPRMQSAAFDEEDAYSGADFSNMPQQGGSMPEDLYDSHSPRGQYEEEASKIIENYDGSYAPSQSQEVPVASEPLSRQGLSARRAPIFAFGFGGKIATTFPAQELVALGDESGNEGAALGYGYGSLRGQVTLRPIEDAVSASAVNASDVLLPGPLLPDGTASRLSDKAAKQKREQILQYLADRVEELEKGLSFLQTPRATRQRREDSAKLVALRILRAYVSNNGNLESERDGQLSALFSLPQRFSSSVPATVERRQEEHFSEEKTLREVEPLLQSGQSSEALRIATEHGAWAQALLIASSLGDSTWRTTTGLYEASLFQHNPSPGLKMTYAIFGGRTVEAVSGLCASQHWESLELEGWESMVAAVVQHGKIGDREQLLRLSSHFASIKLATPALVCYLVSPALSRGYESPSPFDPIESCHPSDLEDVAILSPKQKENPAAALQAWPSKMLRAWRLADRGDVSGAQRYCKALNASTKSGRHRLLADHLDDFLHRSIGEISAVGLSTRSAKTLKPGMDKIGSWFEGRITKFIAGDDDAASAESQKDASGSIETASEPVGPFSHWSSITPAPVPLYESGGGNPGPDANEEIPSSLVAAARLAYMPDDEYASQFTPRNSPPVSYQSLPSSRETPSREAYGEDDEDDLGLGNYSAKKRAPIAPPQEESSQREEPTKPAVEKSAGEAAASGSKASWLGRLWGKKEGEGSGPIRAKLGEESSMVFDPDLKRWIVRGAKPEAPPPAAAPPPRASTASPAPNTSFLGGASVRAAVTNPPSGATTPTAPPFQQAASEGLADSLGSRPPPPSMPPARIAAATGGSALDDLLTRPPSRRPGSAAAKKNIRKRYVDVLQPDA